LEDRTHDGGRRPTLLYLRQQVVNLNRIAEISVKRGRVTLCFAFARLGDPGARLVLAPQEAELLLATLRRAEADLPAWVAIGDRLINLDLAVDVWLARDQVTVVPALPDQRGGPLPRNFPPALVRPLIAYFEHAGVLSREGNRNTPAPERPGWVRAGEHLINLALVGGIRFTGQNVQVVFAGLPRFARSFTFVEAAPLLEQLQQLGGLPIDALYSREPRRPEDAGAATDDGLSTGALATTRRTRFGRWIGRRRE